MGVMIGPVAKRIKYGAIGVTPSQIGRQSHQQHVKFEENDGEWYVAIVSDDGVGHGHEHHAHQGGEIQPLQAPVGKVDQVELDVMLVPEDGDEQEGLHIMEQLRPLVDKEGVELGGGEILRQVEAVEGGGEEGEGHPEHPVREGDGAGRGETMEWVRHG